jgi:hypothetical protein
VSNHKDTPGRRGTDRYVAPFCNRVAEVGKCGRQRVTQDSASLAEVDARASSGWRPPCRGPTRGSRAESTSDPHLVCRTLR